MSALRQFTDAPSLSHSIYGKETDEFIKSNSLLSDPKKVEPTSEERSIEERLFDNRAELKTIAAQLGRAYWDEKLRKQLFQQLDWILDSEEWEDTDSYADKQSFETLVEFVLNAKPQQAPYLNIADDGHLIGTWIKGDNKFRLECFANGRTNWFISCAIDGEEERLGGEAHSLQRLLDRISPFKQAGWFQY
jgi:hypothetical protein